MDDDQDQFDVPAADESLEIVDFGAELEPLGRVAGDPIRRDESGNDSGNFSSVLKEPISLQYAGRRRGGGVAGARIGLGLGRR